jgi:hypothetical protein
VVVTFKKLMAAIAADPELAKQAKAQPAESAEDPKSAAEVKRFFQFIGTYVVLFQEIESKLDQIITMAVGQDRSHIGGYVVSILLHSQKIDFVQAIVKSSAIPNGDPFRAEWLTSFDELIQRLRAEATRRNSIVHSVYILELMEIGGSPLRSKRKRKRGTLDFDQEEIDAEFITRAISELTELSFDVGMAFVQLVHWSELLGRKHPDADGDRLAGNRISDETAKD